MEGEPLAIEVISRTERDRRVIEVAGDLDIATAGRLESAVFGDPGDGAGAVTLDLSRVAFIDSVGLRTLIHCRSEIGDFVLRHPSGVVRRLLSLTRTTDRFSIEDAREDG